MSTPRPDRDFVSGPLRFTGIKKPYLYSEMGAIPQQWNEFGPFIGRVSGQVGRFAYGIVLDSSDTGFSYASAVEIDPSAELPTGLVEITLPAYRYVEFAHHGHVSALSETISTIWRGWLPTSGFQPIGHGVMLECYGDAFDPMTGTGTIQLRFAVEERL